MWYHLPEYKNLTLKVYISSKERPNDYIRLFNCAFVYLDIELFYLYPSGCLDLFTCIEVTTHMIAQVPLGQTYIWVNISHQSPKVCQYNHNKI